MLAEFLILAIMTTPAAADEPIYIPPEADAKQAYYDCMIRYVSDKTAWDATSNELIDIAETTCERESLLVWRDCK